ncbi:MAG: cyclase family protein [Peptostreptococcaceae bacterium]|nr:cyclase family protein [Peptostreptococcaceae bacterium]
MKIFDLTHLIEPDMPVFPGTEPPEIIKANTIEKDGFEEKILKMYSHTGTHMDAPAHLLRNGKTLDRYDAEHFFGKAFVIDSSGAAGGIIEKNSLKERENEIREADYVLFHTDWSRYWGEDEYYDNFPCLDIDAAMYLASFSLKGVGFDTISADPVEDLLLTNHRIILGKGMVIVENLKDLDRLIGEDIFWFSCMPLKTINADGSPVRAIAIIGTL